MTGRRITDLREQLGITLEVLSEKVLCSRRTLQRYENSNEITLPGTLILRNLAIVLNTSTDYLLGLTDNPISIYTFNYELRNFLEDYYKAQNNIPEKGEIYYWLSIEQNDDGSVYQGYQSQWKGFTDAYDKEEIRVPRPVIPEKAIDICTSICGKPIVVNSEYDAQLFKNFGGQAIAKKNICQKYLSDIIKPFIVNSKDFNSKV